MTAAAPFEFLQLTNYQVTASPGFTAWLAEHDVSLALTNTLGHRLFLIGLKPNGQLSVVAQPFDRCMGLVAVDSHTLVMVGRYQIWRLQNALPPGQSTDAGYDRVYIPRLAYTTGVLNVHDVGVEAGGRIIFAATRFACLAAVHARDNFVPLWRPPWISAYAPEDRCHLNGLAIRDGRAAYLTSFSQTDTPEGWRAHKVGGGTVVETATNEVVLAGLTMPHSPRWYRGELWLTQSGTGEFGRVDLRAGHFERVAFAPGFLRGLDFHGDFAVVGSSRPRHGDFFEGLPLGDYLKRSGAAPHRGLYVVDLRAGEVVHWLSLDGVQGEIYDVAALAGARRPTAVSLDTEEIQHWVTVGPLESLHPRAESDTSASVS